MTEQQQETAIDLNLLFASVLALSGPFEYTPQELQETYNSLTERDTIGITMDEESGKLIVELHRNPVMVEFVP